MLDSDLIAAHERNDKPALVSLYKAAAAQAENTNARAFYLTHAYVFALDGGLADAVEIRDELGTLGRD